MLTAILALIPLIAPLENGVLMLMQFIADVADAGGLTPEEVTQIRGNGELQDALFDAQMVQAKKRRNLP